MKKFLLSAFAVAMAAFMGMAQQTVPAAGVINMNEYPAGLGSIEVVGNYEVNPECTGMAQLYQNGVLLRQVPAYAGPLVCTMNGYESSNTIPGLTGDLHITFYADAISPAMQFGSYKVIIPEGFGYDVSGGNKVPTPRIEREFFINVPSLTFFPSRGANVEKIQTIYVTLPEQATNVTVKQMTVNAEAHDEDDNVTNYSYSSYGWFALPEAAPNTLAEDNTVLNAISAKVTGRVVELTFPETTGLNGRAMLTIPAGVISFQVLEGDLKGTYSNSEAGVSLSLVSNVDTGEAKVAPAPGVYSDITSAIDLTQTMNTGNMYAYFFQFTAPVSQNIYMVNGQAQMFKLNDDGTRGAQVATFNMQKIKANVVGLYNSEVSYRPVPTEFYPGPGKYELVIPANKIYYTLTNKNLELSFGPYEFTAKEGADDNFTITPSTTSEIDDIKEIEITFPEDAELAWNILNYATLSNQYTTISIKPTNITNEFAGIGVKKLEGNSVKFELPVELKYAGEWEFSVPASTLKSGSQYVNINKTFTIKSPEIASLEVVSDINNSTITSEWDEDRDTYVYTCVAHTLEDEATFTFEIPNGFTNMYYMRYAVMQNDLTSYRPVSDAIASGMTEGNTITIENGDKNVGYEIAFAIGEDIPEYARYMAIFTVDDNTEVTGVELIKANELVDVYSVTGARVASKVDARILQQLPAGLYIINGKKVLVK